MAYLTLEDIAGKSVAVTVFPSVYKDFGFLVEKDKAVILKGRISSREKVRDDDEGGRNIEILAEEITLLVNTGDAFKNRTGAALHILLDPTKRSVLHLVRAAMEQYSGATPTYLHVENGTQKDILKSNLRVTVDDPLRSTLERLLGKQAIWLDGASV